MKTDNIEGSLRQALAQRAAEIPVQAGDRLRQLDYRPRSRPRLAGVLAAGVVVAALAAGGSAYLSGAGQSRPHSPGGSVAPPAGATISLAGYTFKLPAGFRATDQKCPPPSGGTAGSAPAAGGTRFAAGAAAHGGCVEVLMTSPAPQPSGDPVQVGPYQGYVVSVAASRQVTLQVEVPAVPGDQQAQGSRDLVVSARNLSQNQVIEIAARALAVPYGPSNS